MKDNTIRFGEAEKRFCREALALEVVGLLSCARKACGGAIVNGETRGCFRFPLVSALKIGGLPIWIQDQPGLRPAQIASVARQMHAEGARVIFVDFVQTIAEEGRSAGRRSIVSPLRSGTHARR